MRNNGMLRHPLATLEGGQEFIDFYRALLSREGPLSLVVGSCSLFATSTATKRRVWKNNSLKLKEIRIMKNSGITLIKGNYATSGLQNLFPHLIVVQSLQTDSSLLQIFVYLCLCKMKRIKILRVHKSGLD